MRYNLPYLSFLLTSGILVPHVQGWRSPPSSIRSRQWNSNCRGGVVQAKKSGVKNQKLEKKGFGESESLSTKTSSSELNLLRERREQQAKEKAQIVDEFVQERIQIRENPRAGTIPDAVSKRMLQRIVPLFMIPFFGGIAAFIAFYLYGQRSGNTMQPTIVAFATQAPFLLSLLGLSYGVLSASWDEDVEGSFLGFNEVQTNTQRIFEGLQRTGERRDLEEEIAARERELELQAKQKKS